MSSKTPGKMPRSTRSSRRDSLPEIERLNSEARALRNSSLADALYIIGYCRGVTGDTIAAFAPLQESLELFRTLGERAKQAHAMESLGVANDVNGNAGAAVGILNEALEIFRELDDTAGTASVLKSLGNAWMGTGAYDAAEDGRPSNGRSGVCR